MTLSPKEDKLVKNVKKSETKQAAACLFMYLLCSRKSRRFCGLPQLHVQAINCPPHVKCFTAVLVLSDQVLARRTTPGLLH